ncbi:16S rRNA (guanine(527)-N(7))-methyltransferase RsmG [Sphingomonas cannabina]|uniref:16S rRNA (guanine(527)-N(7))-methyltransferase RsmG n=1 Tax=Sphingomonas cannabina TaxID=2899123 RepID=UPI001F3A6590|nr:16S rRNA (guanine(527)-N(7))-methyltransferase RsmG [Sphingomonas cannabina]UIJ45729.1 16S rRNA (guanine(527)-N(7))-methyltransferase RsmG [Sphingomonas cannabina]
MTEDEARSWIANRCGAHAIERLEHYVDLLVDEMGRQNLIAASTLATLWARHLVDSAQLLELAPSSTGEWIDIGSGAGLPGLVIALASDWHVALVEPRRLRVAFLNHCIEELGLVGRVTVEASKIESVRRAAPARVISARAVAALPQLIASAVHLADRETVWLLPKGSRAQSEVAEARRSWQGVFHVKQSVVDPDSGIVVASRVARRR